MAQDSQEAAIVARAVRRDSEAYAQLFDLFSARVQRHIYYVVGNVQDAGDLTSETFLRGWKVIHKYEDRGISILSWFLKIGHNLAIKHMGRQRPALDLDEALDRPAGGRDFVESICDTDMLRNAVLTLPEVQRQVVIWRYIDQLSYEEVSALLDKPAATVRVIQFRALRKLRELLEPQAAAEASPVPERRLALAGARA